MQVQWKYIETTWNNLTSTNCFLMFLVCQDLSQFKSRWTDWRLIQHDPTKSVAKEHQQTKNHVMTSLQSTVIHSSKSTWVEMSWVPVWVSIASDTRRDSFLRSSMAGWHDIFKLDASFILSQLWHWLPSKQKYVTDCCIAAIFRVAFLSFLLFSKDSLWLLPFSSSSLMTRREEAIENLWRTRMIRSQKALRCQSRRAHIEVKEGWENETQVMDMSYVPAVQRNECVLNQGPPPKTDHFNFGNWILRLQSIHTYEHANNTVLTNKQNPLKHLETLLCEFLHTLKSKSPADTTSSPKRIPEPVSSMLPDRLSATKFDKCQVATTLSLVYCKIM